MTHLQENVEVGSAAPASAADTLATTPHADEDPRAEQPQSGAPRIVSEQHIVGPYGEDEIQATDDRGRRWYDVRPEPRTRADLMGFNFTWWVVAILLVAIFLLPW